eukprot:6174407-Pleurochrysis_carterae.AAC.2
MLQSTGLVKELYLVCCSDEVGACVIGKSATGAGSENNILSASRPKVKTRSSFWPRQTFRKTQDKVPGHRRQYRARSSSSLRASTSTDYERSG